MQYQMIGNILIILTDYLFIINESYVEIFQIKKKKSIKENKNLFKIFKLNHEESFELIF